MQKEETKKLMIEVRKSYRLLYEYQKRILDLVDYIGKKFKLEYNGKKLILEYNGGYSHFSNTSPRNGSGSLDSWAWDWLNMYYYEFHFKDIKIQNKDHKDIIYFSIFLLNDDGYFKTFKEQKIGRASLSNFENAKNSESKLIFVVGKNMWESWGNNWDDLDFVLGIEGKNIKNQQNNQIMIFKHFLVEDFYNEENAIKCLRDFEIFCEGNGINFRIDQQIK